MWANASAISAHPAAIPRSIPAEQRDFAKIFSTICRLFFPFVFLILTYALKILLERGDVPVARRGVNFDAYRNKLTTTWRPWGNSHPIQRLGLMIARKMVMARKARASADEVPLDCPIERIFNLARWAPSGDIEQPWRFDIVDDHHLVIHTSDTRDWCVYDLHGSSTQIAVGALLETLAIAASGEDMLAEFARRPDTPETSLLIDVHLRPGDNITPSPLLPFIKARVAQRRPVTTRSLSSRQKEAVGKGYRVIWLEGHNSRSQMAKLLFHNAHIRLTTPEAYEVHRQNIEWGARFSEDRIPEYAIGVGFPVTKIMRWALEGWGRLSVLNRFFAGTWPPRLQMDLLPGLLSGVHFVIVADEPLASVGDYIDGGRAMQRFWLEATRQGLQFQPESTPVIFSRYVAQSLEFTSVTKEQELAARLAGDLTAILGQQAGPLQRVYMGRVGFGPTPESRSIRPPLDKLLVYPGSW